VSGCGYVSFTTSLGRRMVAVTPGERLLAFAIARKATKATKRATVRPDMLLVSRIGARSTKEQQTTRRKKLPKRISRSQIVQCDYLLRKEQIAICGMVCRRNMRKRVQREREREEEGNQISSRKAVYQIPHKGELAGKRFVLLSLSRSLLSCQCEGANQGTHLHLLCSSL